ncbi:MAG: hypothetical protein EBU97_06295, partial [Rhodobacteraceae bacterium]|nr:hypothetical protein [Paracoccaceae bacterium]
QGGNIGIDMLAGPRPDRSAATGAAARGEALLDALQDTIEAIAVFAAISRTAVDMTLQSGANTTFRTAGDFTVSLTTETETGAEPIALGAGVAVAISEINHRVDLRGLFDVGGDMTVTSTIDATTEASVENEGYEGTAISIGINISILSNVVTVTGAAGSQVQGSLRVQSYTKDRTLTEITSKGEKDAKFALAIGVEVGIGTTTARLSGDWTVGENLVVQATTEKLGIEKPRFDFGLLQSLDTDEYLTIPQESNGLAVSALLGNDSSNVVDDAFEGLSPTETVKAYGIKSIATSLGDSSVLGKFATWMDEQVNDDSEPVKSPTQLTGAIAVGYDQDDTGAYLGAADGSATTITVGGQTVVMGTVTSRPKQSATALSFNEGEAEDTTAGATAA